MILLAMFVGALIFLVTLLFLIVKGNVQGRCPRCDKHVSLQKGIGICANCGVPLQFINNKYGSPQPGLVADFGAFRVNLAQLKRPEDWQLTWKGRCCVCGNPAARTEVLKIQLVSKVWGTPVAPMIDSKTYKFEAAYCVSHDNGVWFHGYTFAPGSSVPSDPNEHSWVIMRSFDYYRDFVQQNGSTAHSAPH
jgi:hypothetical protein